MTQFLLATDSVHTTATLCDYLDGRISGDDAVSVLAVTDETLDERDAADALNVAGVRLGAAGTVDPATRTGDPAVEIQAHATAVGADEILVGVRATDSEDGAIGETTRRVLAYADRPVVVVPVPPLD